MKLVVLIREGTDAARPTHEFVDAITRRYPDKDIEVVNLDTRVGAGKATVYGITEYPALIATTSDGRVQNIWQGMPLPLIDEVASYLLD